MPVIFLVFSFYYWYDYSYLYKLKKAQCLDE